MNLNLSQRLQARVDADGYAIVGPRQGENVGDAINVTAESLETGETVEIMAKVVGIATVAEWEEQSRRIDGVWHGTNPGTDEAIKIIAE